MDKKEFLEEIKEFDDKLGMWQIVVDKLCTGDFILGCYFDEDEKVWEVYIHNERGRHREGLSTTSEHEAYKKLYSMIKFQYETINL